MKLIYLLTLTLFISVAVFAQEPDTTKVEQQPVENHLPFLAKQGIAKDKISPLKPGLEDRFIQLMEQTA